jgi:ATP-dependent protease ClpP protease subunit
MKTIVIDGVIGKGEGEISSSMVLEQLPTDGSPIHVKIHSEGGEVFEGFRLHDVFANYPGEKKLTIESSAFSIASFIPTAFDDVEICPNGYLMLHPPRMSMEDATSGDMDQKSVLLKQLEQSMYQEYAKRSGKSVDEIKAICEKETFLNAQQCVELGLANRITQKPVVGRVFAKTNNLPHGVVAALFGAGSGGNKNSQPKEKPMSESKPVAATVRQIKAAFPKAKETFIVRCMEKEMPMEEVTTAMGEELQEENETLSAKVKAMEEELSALKAAKAMEEEQVQMALAKAKAEEDEMCKAKAQQSGVKPVAKSQAPVAATSARARWTGLVSAKIQSGLSREKAILEVEKADPNIRLEMLSEVNS